MKFLSILNRIGVKKKKVNLFSKLLYILYISCVQPLWFICALENESIFCCLHLYFVLVMRLKKDQLKAQKKFSSFIIPLWLWKLLWFLANDYHFRFELIFCVALLLHSMNVRQYHVNTFLCMYVLHEKKIWLLTFCTL